MTTSRELLQQALEFAESVHSGEWGGSVDRDKLVEAIRAHLAKPEAAPVAWALQMPNEPLPRQIWTVKTGFDTAMERWPEAYKGAYKLPLYRKEDI